MKKINNYITERLKLTSKSDTIPIDFSSANYVANNLKDMNHINPDVFDTNEILPFVHGLLTEWPIYVWEFEKSNGKEVAEFQNTLRNYTKFLNVDMTKIKTDTLSSKNAVAVICYTDNLKYAIVVRIDKDNPTLYMCFNNM